MSISSKLSVLRQVANGSRCLSDLGMFWRRPLPWVGGELANRAGLQVLRTLYQGLRHRPSTRLAPPRLHELAGELIDTGMIIIPDFLPRETFEKIRDEYRTTFNTAGTTIRKQSDHTVNDRRFQKCALGNQSITSAEIRGAKQEAVGISADSSPTAVEHIVMNKDIWALAGAAMGKRVKYRPGAYFQRESRLRGASDDTEQNIILHEDVFYHSMKVFYYINDNTVDNGAFVVVPKTQRIDGKRLRHEYRYSIDIARQMKGKSVSHPLHESQRMQVYGPTYNKDDLQEVHAEGKANTLVIANTMAFHRRGGTAIEGDREQIRMCFRHVETLHHKLYPLLDTKRSKNLTEAGYF